MPKGKGSRAWLREHFSDPYVKRARQEGYRSRAVYKLMALQERDHLFRPGGIIVELGAAPGGWSQYLAKLTGKKGRIVALDILPMEPVGGVEFIQGDFTEQWVEDLLIERLAGVRPEWVVSDMAPEMSGIDSVDQPRSLELAVLAREFAIKVLAAGGGFLVKVFQGEGFEAYLRELRQQFAKVVIRKPEASRARSNEVYLVAKNLLNKSSSGMIATSASQLPDSARGPQGE